MISMVRVEARRQQRRDRDQQKEGRNRKHDLEDPRNHQVDPRAEIAGDRAEDNADQQRDPDRDKTDGERNARAVDHAGSHVAAQLIRTEQMFCRRRFQRFEQIDVTRPIGNRRIQRFRTFELFEIDVEQFRRPLPQLGADEIAAQDGEIAFALVIQVVRFVVGDKIREQRHEYEQADDVEPGERDRIVFEAPPDIRPESLGDVGVCRAGRLLCGLELNCR